LRQDLIILQPENLKDESFINELSSLKPDLQVVVAFRMLPRSVWTIPALGTINLHSSLLPQYRGAAPINHAIINGEHKTGVTTFLIDEKIDTGRILFREETLIGEEETAGELHDRLMIIGAGLVVKTVNALVGGKYQPIDQEEVMSTSEELKPAPKIFKDDCIIRWNQPVSNVYNFIRGLSPYPGAFSIISDNSDKKQVLKILKASKLAQNPGNNLPGTPETDNKSFLRVACTDGWIEILELQLEGKKRMPVIDFLRGFDATNIVSLS
jgi:methionyl-tRNA formyltransferase